MTKCVTIIWYDQHLNFNSCVFMSRCSNFFLPVNWHDHNNSDITRIKTFKIICVYSQWSKYSIDRSHSVTSGLFPVLSDVENLVLKNFYCTKRFAVKFQGESPERFFTFDSIQRMKSSIYTLEPVNWQIKAQLLSTRPSINISDCRLNKTIT